MASVDAIARSHARYQLTTGGRRHALNGGNHRQRQIDDLLHHCATQGHDLAEIGSTTIAVATPAGEFLEIMTRAEGRTIGGKHNCAHGLVGRKFGKAVGQSNQQGFRQTVAGFRTIEHEDGYVAITLAQQHGRIGSELGRRSIHLKHSHTQLRRTIVRSWACARLGNGFGQ